MALRAFVMYLGTLILVRLGKKRFMGQNSAFDVVLLFILGSVLSRGVDGTAPMWGSFMAGLALVACTGSPHSSHFDLHSLAI